MADTLSSVTAEQARQADIERTKRAFVGLVGAALGVEQSYSQDDGYIVPSTGQYVIANPDGTYSQQGTSNSNLNSGLGAGFVLTPGLLLIGALLFFALKK